MLFWTPKVACTQNFIDCPQSPKDCASSGKNLKVEQKKSYSGLKNFFFQKSCPDLNKNLRSGLIFGVESEYDISFSQQSTLAGQILAPD